MDPHIDKRKLSAGLATFVVIGLVLWFLFGRPSSISRTPVAVATPATAVDIAANSTTIEAMKKAGPVAGSPLFGVHVQELPSADVTYTCAQAPELRRRADASASSNNAVLFWQSDSAPAAFLYYETETRRLVACDGKSVVSTILKENGLAAKDEVVKIDQPHFGDWAHDGKFEFLLFRGQCDDGPCLGLFHLLQIDRGHLNELAEINASAVDTEQMSVGGVSRTSLEVRATCYGLDVDPVFEYVALLDYGGSSVLSLVPPQQIRIRAPELIQQMSDSEFEPDGSASQAALAKLQALIFQSYQAKPLADLKKQYEEILSAIPNLKAGDPPPLQCDPIAILTMNSEGK